MGKEVSLDKHAENAENHSLASLVVGEADSADEHVYVVSGSYDYSHLSFMSVWSSFWKHYAQQGEEQ